MQETLRLDITADNKEAIAVLKQTDAALLKVGTTSTKVGAAVAKSSNQAGNALTNLGRVAQDAPYGFIGIQNNLNPLLESFQRLKADSGSTSGALKAMAAGLMGPAGLGIALSVGSALALTFGDDIMAMVNGTGAAAKANEELRKSMDGFRQTAAKEIISFKELTITAADSLIPMEQRKQAVDELQKKYPAYLKGLSEEDILSGKIGDSYNKITDALKAKIALQAAEEKLIPIIKEQLAVSERLADAQKKVQAASGLTAKDFENSTMNGRNFAKELQAAAIGATSVIEKEAKAYAELDTKINKIFGSMQPFIAASNGLNYTLEAEKTNVDSLTKSLEQYLAVHTIISKSQFKPVTAAPVTAGVQGQTGVASKENVQLEQSALMTREQLILSNANAQKLYNQQQAQANELANIGAGVFTDLGNAMLTGQDMGEALANTFKKLAADLAQMVIKALIFKAIMAAITGGGSAVTSGATAGMSIFNGMSFADGGIASGPKSGYPALLHGTEAILNPGQFKNLTSNMMNMGAMQGKSNDSSGFVASTSIRGSEMLLMIKRAEANMGLKRG